MSSFSWFLFLRLLNLSSSELFCELISSGLRDLFRLLFLLLLLSLSKALMTVLEPLTIGEGGVLVLSQDFSGIPGLLGDPLSVATAAAARSLEVRVVLGPSGVGLSLSPFGDSDDG